jgi:hypothetical protein
LEVPGEGGAIEVFIESDTGCAAREDLTVERVIDEDLPGAVRMDTKLFLAVGWRRVPSRIQPGHAVHEGDIAAAELIVRPDGSMVFDLGGEAIGAVAKEAVEDDLVEKVMTDVTFSRTERDEGAVAPEFVAGIGGHRDREPISPGVPPRSSSERSGWGRAHRWQGRPRSL